MSEHTNGIAGLGKEGVDDEPECTENNQVHPE